MTNNYLCNYHFVTECWDFGKPKESKCSGVSEEESNKGICCENAHKEQSLGDKK